MIKLYQFAPLWGIANPSPFCMKLETYLHMAQLPYEIVTVSNPHKSPKGKLPHIVDGNKTIADSSFIIDYLKQTYGDPVDGELTDAQKALALTIQRTVEEHLYWCALFTRWVDPNGWKITKPAYFSIVPGLIRNIVANKVRKMMSHEIYQQGIGRHRQEEVYDLACRDITALAVLLGEQRYFMGERATTIDASVHAFLSNILDVPYENQLKEHTKTYNNLCEYNDRMTELFYATVD